MTTVGIWYLLPSWIAICSWEYFDKAYGLHGFTTDSSEGIQLVCLIPAGSCRIRQAPVCPSTTAGKDRTRFGSVVTDGNDILEGRVQKLIQVFRMLSADIDPNLLHGSNRQWVQGARRSPGALDLQVPLSKVAQETFSHLRAGGVARTEDEDPACHSESYYCRDSWRRYNTPP